jgi:hypothetical protein
LGPTATKAEIEWRERIELAFSPEYMMLARRALVQVNRVRIQKNQPPIDIRVWFKWLITLSLAQTIAETESSPDVPEVETQEKQTKGEK